MKPLNLEEGQKLAGMILDSIAEYDAETMIAACAAALAGALVAAEHPMEPSQVIVKYYYDRLEKVMKSAPVPLAMGRKH